MGLFSKLFKHCTENPDIPPQDYKNNIYESEISQYSSLPRYYYIQGQKYDIDSPESVASIPICKTKFSINGEIWGIDTILREHINRYYSKIPDKLKEVGYKKISEYGDSEYFIESSAEKEARIKTEKARIEMIRRREEITLKDMEQFALPSYMLGEIVYAPIGPIILINAANQADVLLDIEFLNQFSKEAQAIAGIQESLKIRTEEVRFSVTPKELERARYYTYFICTPYTKTKKFSKYPIHLRYETKSLDPEKKNTEFVHGDISYLQDGSMGKASMGFTFGKTSYGIDLGLKGTTLTIKKITKAVDGVSETIYKNN